MWWDRTSFVELYRLWTVMMTPPFLRPSYGEVIRPTEDEKTVLERLINNQIILLEQMGNLKDQLETQTKEIHRLQMEKE